MAVQFKFLFKQIQNEWFQEIKDTVTGQALTEIRKLKPEKVHMAKTVVKNLQGMGSSIGVDSSNSHDVGNGTNS